MFTTFQLSSLLRLEPVHFEFQSYGGARDKATNTVVEKYIVI